MSRRFAAPVSRTLLLVSLAAAGAAGAPWSVMAQQPPGAPAAKAPAATRAPQKPAGAETPSGGESGLRQRVEQLEEQLVDMQVVIGTLESLARGGGAAPAARGGLAPSESARIDGLETQIRALTAQVEQFSAQTRDGTASPQRRTEAGEGASSAAPREDAASAAPSTPTESQFGSTTVTAESQDPIGGLLSSDSPAARPPAAAEATPDAGLAPGAAANPKQLYETAYGYLLQRNYTAAETAFAEFLKRYPNDSLSGNAQYWLGETHYVRGEYKAAAGAFLKGYETYGASAKAADSLLKLAMSLDRLGQKDAACSSYSELTAKFPNAPPSVKSRAQAERQRVGCP